MKNIWVFWKKGHCRRADTDLSFPVCSSICHKITQIGPWSAWPCNRHGSCTWCAYSVFSTKLTHTFGADVDLSRWPSCGAGGREWWVERGDWRPGDRDPELLSARYLKSPVILHQSTTTGHWSIAHYSSQRQAIWNKPILHQSTPMHPENNQASKPQIIT